MDHDLHDHAIRNPYGEQQVAAPWRSPWSVTWPNPFTSAQRAQEMENDGDDIPFRWPHVDPTGSTANARRRAMSSLLGRRIIRIAGAALAVLALVATACGKSGDTGSGGSTTEAGGQTTEGTGATVSAKNVNGLGMVLVDSRGFTLYRLTGETASNIMCNASCAATWPPLEASGTPKGGSGATGTLATTMRPDGTEQVTYQGVPLYTFAGDSGPGQSNGEGIQGVWFAVTPAGQSAKGGAGGTSPAGSGYPGGY